MIARSFRPLDPFEPTESTRDDVSGFVDDLHLVITDLLTGERYVECRVCGMETGHSATCFVPAMKRFAEGGDE